GVRSNWRFQQALYRANYDAHVHLAAIAAEKQQDEVINILNEDGRRGSAAALDAALTRLSDGFSQPPSPPRAQVGRLADDLFHSIKMQLSVPIYDAIATDRGANLDTADMPLNDRVWLRGKLGEIRRLASELERLSAISALLDRTDP